MVGRILTHLKARELLAWEPPLAAISTPSAGPSSSKPSVTNDPNEYEKLTPSQDVREDCVD